MPFCPNCGSYIPLGNHSCSCGTHIRYDFEDGAEYGGGSSKPQDNPYDSDFLNELYHEGVSPYIVDRIAEGITGLENKFGCEFEGGEVYNNIAYLNLKFTGKYFDATLRATYGLDDGFDDVTLLKDIITPDFSKLYSSEEIKKLILEMEAKTNSKFHHFKILIVEDTIMISAIFDFRGYIIDFENMCLIE